MLGLKRFIWFSFSNVLSKQQDEHRLERLFEGWFGYDPDKPIEMVQKRNQASQNQY